MEDTRAQARAIRAERRSDRHAHREQPSTNVVACRIDDDVLEALDILIEAGVFGTRSEAAGAMIKSGLERNRELISEVAGTVSEIRRLRENLAGKARKVMGTDGILPTAPTDAGDAGAAPPAPE